MSRLLKFFVSLFIGLVVFALVIWRVGLASLGQALSLFFGFEGLLAIFFGALFVILGIIKWRLILKSEGYQFSFCCLSPLWLIGFALSYLTPFAVFGGEVFRIYFTKKHLPQIPPEKNMASVAVDRILDATVFLGFLIIGVLVFSLYGKLPGSFLGLGSFLITATLFFFLVVFYFKQARRESILDWLFKVFSTRKVRAKNGKTAESIYQAEREVFQFFSVKNKALWQSIGLSILRYSMLSLRCLFLIFFFTGKFSFLKALAVQGFANLAALTPFPATLGALEVSEGFAFKVLGLGFGNGAVFSMLWRGADLVIVLFALLLFVKLSIVLISKKLKSWAGGA